MRALAPPPGRVSPARTASAQSTAQGVSRSVLRRGGMMGGDAQTDGRWLSQYNQWQAFARRFSRQISAASFNAQVISDLSGRCDVRVEIQMSPTEWEPFEDSRFDGLMELYANELQGPAELIRHQAWHYSVAGEMVQSQRDGASGGVEYGIHSAAAIDWDKPAPGWCIVKLTPDGKVEKGTAFAIPREQAYRFWVPDHEWPAYAWSPMAATIDDLKRWRSLARYSQHVADSALAMDGVFWVPSEALEGGEEGDGVDGVADGGGGVGTSRSNLEDQYYDLAKVRFSESDDVTAVAPAFLHWDKDFGKPEWTKMGEGLDPNAIAHRAEAIADFARGTTLPVTSVTGGGVGDANHWSEWLATDKMVDSGVRPVMDRITHLDITRSFLWPHAVMAGYPVEQLARLRIGYDATPIIVKPDRSETAIKLNERGLLADVPTLDECGWSGEDRMVDVEEREWLLEVLSHGKGAPAGDAPLPASSGSTRQVPPVRPGGDAAALAASLGEEPPPAPADEPGAAKAREVLAQVMKLRQSVGTRLIADAQAAYEGALRVGGMKVRTRAKGRLGADRAAQVAAVVAERGPLQPWLAAVKISDLELVDQAFDTFRSRALAELAAYRTRVAGVLERAGLSNIPSGISDRSIEDSVDFMVAGLTAMARARLLQGDEAITAAARDLRHLAPRAPRRQSGGFDMPGLPDPDELAGAAARLVRNALSVVEGRASMTMPTTPDGMPTTTATMETVLAERLTVDLEVKPNWTWAHGFYGAPASPFEPHEQLDGFTTTDREHDPELANLDAWPDVDVFAPNDHPGCTCEWVPAV